MPVLFLAWALAGHGPVSLVCLGPVSIASSLAHLAKVTLS